MERIGALHKSGSQSTIYFCEYDKGVFDWEDVVSLLSKCRLMSDLTEDDIYCVAVETIDDMQTDKRLVGIVYKDGIDYVSLVPQDYSDLDIFLKELTGG